MKCVIRLYKIARNLRISPVQKTGWEKVASVLLQEVDPRGPLPRICFPKISGVNIISSMNNNRDELDWMGAQRSRIRGRLVRLGERRAFETSTMALRFHPEGSRMSEGLQQSVQGQTAGYPQLIVSFLAFFGGSEI